MGSVFTKEDRMSHNNPGELIPFENLREGDIISVPAGGIFGVIASDTFYHTGVYIGHHMVISKYLDKQNDENLVEGPGIIKMESIKSKMWQGWKRILKGDVRVSQNAFKFFEAYNNGYTETYHLRSNNCQHFTQLCVALVNGIGSTIRVANGH